jgi:hypothetical protein
MMKRNEAAKKPQATQFTALALNKCVLGCRPGRMSIRKCVVLLTQHVFGVSSKQMVKVLIKQHHKRKTNKCDSPFMSKCLFFLRGVSLVCMSQYIHTYIFR